MEEQLEQQVDTTEIGKEAIAERKAEKAGSGKKPWEAQFERDHAELAKPAKVKFEKAVEKAIEEAPAEIEEAPKKVEEKVEETEEKPDSEEQPAEAEEQPAEEQPSKEEAKPEDAKKDTAKEEAYIAKYAKKNGLEVEKAKEEIAQNKALLAKYNNDPIEVAKAYRLTQSAYDKLKTQSEQNQQQSVPPQLAQIMADPKGYVRNAVETNKVKLLEEYRTNNPARSDLMTDDAILEELRDKLLGQVEGNLKEFSIKMSKEAITKRSEFIASVDEKDRRFLPEIKTQLDKFPDHMIVGKDFNFKDLVSWARGSHVDRIEKEAEERGYKRGLEKARILGEVGKSAPSNKVKPRVAGSADVTLTPYQQNQAREMFSGLGDEKEMFKAYKEVVIDRKKK